MTKKRYYKKIWEGEYYIFDSETITEKEFEERLDYEGYNVFADSLTGEEIIDLLNKNKELKSKLFEIKNTLAYRSNQIALLENLIDDLGSDEMKRQADEVLE